MYDATACEPRLSTSLARLQVSHGKARWGGTKCYGNLLFALPASPAFLRPTLPYAPPILRGAGLGVVAIASATLLTWVSTERALCIVRFPTQCLQVGFEPKNEWSSIPTPFHTPVIL